MKLTVRFTASDGVEYTGQATVRFPSYDPPRRGAGVTVRYLPQDPGDFEIGAEAPPLLDELERLAALHRAGSPTDAEFAPAKARLLASPG